jgi:uncharacterized protein YbcI
MTGDRPRTETETPGRPGYPAAARISAQMVQLALRHLGRGPTRARTSINANFVLVVLDDVLTRTEKNLVEAGERELIRRQRQVFAELMRGDAIEIVQEAIGRRVRSLLSDIDPDCGVSALVFLLEPATETGSVTVAEVDRETVEDELDS